MANGAVSVELLLVTAVMGAWVAAALYVILRRRGEVGAAVPMGLLAPGPLPGASARLPAAPPPAPAPREQHLSIAQMLEEAPNPIWRRDGEMNLLYVNAAYVKLVGAASADDVIARQIELGAGSRSYAAQARDGARATIHPERVVARGDRQMMEVINIPIGRGEVAGFAVDGTGRHQATNVLARQARALHEALGQLMDAIALFDPGGQLAYHNRTFERLFNLEGGWLDSRPHLEDLLDVMHERRRLPETRDFAAWRTEHLHWLKLDGEAASEMWTLASGEMLEVRARSRTDGGLLLLVSDVSERIRLAGERSALLEVHQAMLDHVDVGIVVFGPDGSIRLFNRRAFQVFVVPDDFLETQPTAQKLIDHVEQFLAEPERAKNLRMLILAATTGREERRGTISSTLGYVVNYATVPLPDGNALLTFSSMKVSDFTPPAPSA